MTLGWWTPNLVTPRDYHQREIFEFLAAGRRLNDHLPTLGVVLDKGTVEIVIPMLHYFNATGTYRTLYQTFRESVARLLPTGLELTGHFLHSISIRRVLRGIKKHQNATVRSNGFFSHVVYICRIPMLAFPWVSQLHVRHALLLPYIDKNPFAKLELMMTSATRFTYH